MVILSLVANILLTALQAWIGLWTGSQALVADSVHSLSDLLSDVIVLVAGRAARKAPDADHPYGHRRYENLATLSLGLLLSAAAWTMASAAISQLLSPVQVSPLAPWALGVALLTLLAKEALFRLLLAEGRREGSQMKIANAWHARSDAASSLIVALGIGGSLLGMPLLDPAAALLVALMVGRLGLRFTWTAVQDLVDRSADETTVDAMRQTLLRIPGIEGLHDLKTRKAGDLWIVDVHLEVDGRLSVRAAHELAVQARQQLLQHHQTLEVMTHLDPSEQAPAELPEPLQERRQHISPASLLKEADHLPLLYQRWIQQSPYVVVGTAGPNGLDVSPRGDPAPVVQIENERTLLLPERRGNNRLDGLQNLLTDSRIALLFLIPGVNESLRVNGRAEVSTDPDLLARLAVDGKPPIAVLRVQVEQAFFQCGRAAIRADLWSGKTVTPGQVPTAGEMLSALTGGQIDGGDYDARLPQRQRETLY